MVTQVVVNCYAELTTKGQEFKNVILKKIAASKLVKKDLLEELEQKQQTVTFFPSDPMAQE